jgi:hypothetical protein
LCFDGGETSIQGIDPDLLLAFPVRDWQDYNDAYEYLSEADHPYKSVSIDSVSETHVYSILNIVDTRVAELIELSKKEGKEVRGRRIDNTILEQEDYGHAMVQMRRFIRSFLRLPFHCFFTALPKSEKKAREGIIQLPAMFGQMAEELVGMFDTTAYIAMEEIKVKNPETKKESFVFKRIMSLQDKQGIRVKVRMPFGVDLEKKSFAVSRKTGVTQLFDLLQIPHPQP